MNQKHRYAAIAVIVFILGLAAVVVFRGSDSPPATSSPSSASDKLGGGGTSSSDLAEKSTTGTPSEKPGAPASSRPEATPDAPQRTKVRDRDFPDFSARKLARVDMTLPPEEISLPEGPPLFAELLTESKRFTNLALNNIGIMPRVFVAPGEQMLVTFTLPEASPGDEIHVELADGGHFADLDAPGRLLTVGENKQFEIRFEAPTQRGHFNLILNQSGHTRTLPLWAGPRPELASGDPE